MRLFWIDYLSIRTVYFCGVSFFLVFVEAMIGKLKWAGKMILQGRVQGLKIASQFPDILIVGRTFYAFLMIITKYMGIIVIIVVQLTH